MPRLSPCLLTAILIATVSGCGTMSNLGIGPTAHGPSAASFAPFGGVMTSGEYVYHGITEFGSGGQVFYIPVVTESIALLMLADVPLSLVGDVVTLPVCLYHIGHPAPPLPAVAPVEAAPIASRSADPPVLQVGAAN